MKKLMIVANWKCNKTVGEATEWLEEISKFQVPLPSSGQAISNDLEIVLCAPFTLLPLLSAKVSKLTRSTIAISASQNQGFKVKLGAQDVSPFPDGAYTGEISARMLRDLGVEYVMIGHSERRKYFKEDEQMLANKVKEALDIGLIPIYCVQGKTTPVPDGVKVILYEPSTAIGTGQPGSLQEADVIAKTLKGILGREVMILYGGSISSENVGNFCREENLSGVGVGGASLDPKKFLEIIENAAKA